MYLVQYWKRIRAMIFAKNAGKASSNSCVISAGGTRPYTLLMTKTMVKVDLACPKAFHKQCISHKKILLD